MENTGALIDPAWKDLLPHEDVFHAIASLLPQSPPLWQQIARILLLSLPPGYLYTYFDNNLPEEIVEQRLDTVLTLIRFGCIHQTSQLPIGLLLNCLSAHTRPTSVRWQSIQIIMTALAIPLDTLVPQDPNDDSITPLIVHSLVPQQSNTASNLMDALIQRAPIGVNIYGYLLPSPRRSTYRPRLIETKSMQTTLSQLSAALLTEYPILLCGEVGCGKSVYLRELAEAVGALEHLVEIFIDSQTDCRALVGAYICSDIPGEFNWRAGVITQVDAVLLFILPFDDWYA